MFIDPQNWCTSQFALFLHPSFLAPSANDKVSELHWFDRVNVLLLKPQHCSFQSFNDVKCRWFTFMRAHISSACFITVANRWVTLLITHPFPSCRDECWTYMYKVDPTATAIPSLVTHCGWVATGLHIFDLLASRPAVNTVVLDCPCRSWKNREPRLKLRYNKYHVILKRVITSFRCMYLFYWKLLYMYKFSGTLEGCDYFNVCRMLLGL